MGSLFPFVIATQGQDNDKPDLIIHNGSIITMEPEDDKIGYIEVKDGLISILSEDPIEGYFSDSDVKKIDLNGGTLFPGFIDSHSHWIGDIGLYIDTADEAISLALAHGWTSISELFVNRERLDELISLDNENRLKLRVNAYLPLSSREGRFGDWYQAYNPHTMMSDNVRIGGVKLFMDNGPFLGYEGRNYWFTPEELNPIVETAHDLGYQIAIHSIVDNATDMALNALDLVQGDNSDGKNRHRIEHNGLLRDDQITRMREMNIIVSAQLLWFTSDWIGEIEAEQGYEDYLNYIARWRDVLDSNVKFIGGTDKPWSVPDDVVTSTELFYRATTRIGSKGITPPDYLSDQRITIQETLKSITIDAAFGTFEEDIKGSIKVGKLADFTLLSKNPMNVEEDELRGITVDMTIIGGEVMYCKIGLEEICQGYDVGSGPNDSSFLSVDITPILIIPILISVNRRRKEMNRAPTRM